MIKLIRQKRIYREDLKANPNVLYIFGDNLERTGFGGQAKEMRGEPNSTGIATKVKAVHGSNDCYFSDKPEYFNIINNEFAKLYQIINSERNFHAVIIPLDGIGTGLALLPEKAPKLLEHIEKKMQEFEAWLSVQTDQDQY